MRFEIIFEHHKPTIYGSSMKMENHEKDENAIRYKLNKRSELSLSSLCFSPFYVSLFAFRPTRMTRVSTGRRYFRRASWTWRRRRRPSDLFFFIRSFFFYFVLFFFFYLGIFRQDPAVRTINLTNEKFARSRIE